MLNATGKLPSFCKHRATGRAVVRLSGKDIYLGPYGSAAAKAEYDRLIAEWLANGRQLLRPDDGLSVAELILAYVHWAATYYLKGGKATSEFHIIRLAMKWLKADHGRIAVAEFGPRAFKAVRERMVVASLSRKTVNEYSSRIKRCFRWGTEQELVPPSVYHGLQAVAGLKRGRCEAHETPPVKPVPQSMIDAVMRHVRPQIAAMIEFQLFTGCRPGEAAIIRGCDIDMTGRVWIYRPHDHKTEHHGFKREIYIGQRTQKIIKPWLRTELEAYLFQPCEAEAARRTERRENRRSPMTPSQAKRQPRRKPRRAPTGRYTVASYRRAIARGCEVAFGMPEWLRKPPCDEKGNCRLEVKEEKEARLQRAAEWRREHCWHPHQLRHNAATNFRKEFGVEVARIILGHKTAFTTEIYAEVDQQQAMQAMWKAG
jgi:integrase